MIYAVTRRLPEGPWDPTKIPCVQQLGAPCLQRSSHDITERKAHDDQPVEGIRAIRSVGSAFRQLGQEPS